MLGLVFVGLGDLGVVSFRRLLRGEAEFLGLGLGVLEFGSGLSECLLEGSELGGSGLQDPVCLGDGVELRADLALLLVVHPGALVILRNDDVADRLGLGLPLTLGGSVHFGRLGVERLRPKLERS